MSERPHAWGAAGGAGSARRGRGRGRGRWARRGRPLPLPSSRRATRAAGVSAPGREMRLPLGLLAGNAPGGPCRAERGRAHREASRVGRGADAGSPLLPRPRLRGPGGGAAGVVGAVTRTAAGAGVAADTDSGRPGVSSTRDKGRGVEGALSACRRSGLQLLRSLLPEPWSPSLPQLCRRSLGPERTRCLRHLVSGRRATPRLAAAPAMAWLSRAAWPSALG